MLTAYDFPTAQILDRAGVPVLLVGDSLGRNALGYANELPVTMDEMLHHVKAVARGASRAMVVGDLPFMSYQASIEDGVRNAGRLVKEGGAHAVKLEGLQPDLVHRLTEIGIPAMAHVGLTPQAVLRARRLQGARQGRSRPEGAGPGRAARESRSVRDRAGGMPAELAAEITGGLQIPTIGIGAGSAADAQVLVINDLLGLTEKPPKLAKAYADLRGEITRRGALVHRRCRGGHVPRRGPLLLLAEASRPRSAVQAVLDSAT